MRERPLAGPLTLVGSGEYLPVMEPIDALLLDRAGGATARVVILATAAGLEEPSSPIRWTRMGMEHFARLGVRVESADILTRDDAHDRRWLPLLETADFYYFSGGNPAHVVQTLVGSPAWEVISRRHAAGAVLAGCSAGAMAFGGYIAELRSLLSLASASGQQALFHRPTSDTEMRTWTPALGLLPGLIVLPHFDRMTAMVGRGPLAWITRALPSGVTLIGIDEETALVRLARPETADVASRWQVMGNKTVSVFAGDGVVTIYRVGEQLTLEDRPAPAADA